MQAWQEWIGKAVRPKLGAVLKYHIEGAPVDWVSSWDSTGEPAYVEMPLPGEVVRLERYWSQNKRLLPVILEGQRVLVPVGEMAVVG